MVQLYTILAILIAGMSLAMAIISLSIGINRPSRADRLFALMGLLLTIFFLIPPVGFILHDVAPYPLSILVKRIFIFSYFGIAPWFILAYTGYPRKGLAWVTSVLAIIAYGMMFFTIEDRQKPLWVIASLAGYTSVFIQGIVASVWQYRFSDKQSARWLMIAMGFYGVLLIFGVINQFSDGAIARFLNMKLFFPINASSLLFMLIMAARVAGASIQRHKLDAMLRDSEKRWKFFMLNVPAIVLELDRDGRIVYVNDSGIKLLGRNELSELIGIDWYTNTFHTDVARMKNNHADLFREGIFMPAFTSTIINARGDTFLISWVNFTTENTGQNKERVISIGKDVTEEHSVRTQVNQLQKELEKEKINHDGAKDLSAEGIVGNSKALRYAITKSHQVAATQTPVLIEGETGVGKELFAYLIQRYSSRHRQPFVKVNCGALPKELIESELFGHEKGAFTSAIQARKGRFELADGGTIFLDEIGELPPDMQPKLLRVLQNGEFDRIGGEKTIKVNVRVIAATNRNLASEVQQGRFRADLFYRLNVFPITIPPLRNRKEDLPELINHFIIEECRKHNKSLEHISKADLHRLIDYAWPGNIRELKNVIERSVIASANKRFSLEWWEDEDQSIESPNHSMEHVERDHILSVMERTNWKINGENGAAEILEMHPNTLRSKMKRLGITRPDPKDPNAAID